MQKHAAKVVYKQRILQIEQEMSLYKYNIQQIARLQVRNTATRMGDARVRAQNIAFRKCCKQYCKCMRTNTTYQYGHIQDVQVETTSGLYQQKIPQTVGEMHVDKYNIVYTCSCIFHTLCSMLLLVLERWKRATLASKALRSGRPGATPKKVNKNTPFRTFHTLVRVMNAIQSYISTSYMTSIFFALKANEVDKSARWSQNVPRSQWPTQAQCRQHGTTRSSW